jgi:N4-gp56 family major capsid protein
MFTWTFDAPAGVYKNHEMSSRLRMAAIAETKFMQFVRPEGGYGKKKGESITITRVAAIAPPTNGRILENNRIPEDELVLSTSSIKVSEWGRSVPYTSLAEDLGTFDLQNVIQKALRNQMAQTLDNAAATSFKSALVKATPTGATSIAFGTSGVAPATATVNLNMYHVEQIRDYMYSTLLVQPYDSGGDDNYLCLISTKGKRGIMSDTRWEEWHKYVEPQYKYRGEIGKIENIRFIEIQSNSALSNALGTGGVLGEAVFFGEDAVAMAVAEDPELRAAIPQDFGRAKSVAWYGILDFGQVWDSANPGESRSVHVTSL